jgi:hypothetical protein
MSFYVFYTWLITALICPFVFFIGLSAGEYAKDDAAFGVFFYFIGGFFYFIPCLGACMLVSRFLIPAAIAVKADDSFGNFLLWIVLTAVVVFAVGILFRLFFYIPADEFLWYVWYIIVSVWIASIIRYRYFIKLVKQKTA